MDRCYLWALAYLICSGEKSLQHLRQSKPAGSGFGQYICFKELFWDDKRRNDTNISQGQNTIIEKQFFFEVWESLWKYRRRWSAPRHFFWHQYTCHNVMFLSSRNVCDYHIHHYGAIHFVLFLQTFLYCLTATSHTLKVTNFETN